MSSDSFQPPLLAPSGVSGCRRFVASVVFATPLLALVALWEVIVRILDVNPRVFPDVESVARAGLETIQDGTLVRHIGASLGRVAVGTSLAIVVSIPLGVAMGLSRGVSGFLTPLFRFFSVLAGIAWIPIATLWFGYGFGAITFVIFNAVFFVVAYNTLLGVSSIPLPLRRAAASLGASGWTMLTQVILPGALPTMLVGSRLAMGSSWTSVVAAELAVGAKAGGGGTGGIGQMMFTFYLYQNDSNPIVACMITVGVVGFLLDRVARAVSLWLVPWSHRGA